eukprot:TRINITY_DN1432_c0_g1_i3.p2 TRINITY_DN1432_c0_g1~~TRINITY_DN1432_c0_g1_i3.p2  ORF type:complete len:380 (+),score=110.97 TRINITY_DN1432_c0_g1_i3:21-1160(+)
MEALQLLRNAVVSGVEVQRDGDAFVFAGGVRMPKETPTAFRGKKGTGDYYSLEAAWFCLQHQVATYPQYVALCTQNKIAIISLMERREFLQYITGKTDTSACISLIPPPPLPSTQAEAPASQLTADAPAEQPAASAAAAPAPQEIQMNEKLAAEKQKLAQKLEQRDASTATAKKRPAPQEVPGLSADKLEELRMKRQKKKQQEITVDDDLPKEPAPDTLGFVEADAQVTRDIVDRERPPRTRSSITQSSKKKFGNVIEMVNKMLREQQDSRARRRASDVSAGRGGEAKDPSWVAPKPNAADLESIPLETQITIKRTEKPAAESTPSLGSGTAAATTPAQTTAVATTAGRALLRQPSATPRSRPKPKGDIVKHHIFFLIT